MQAAPVRPPAAAGWYPDPADPASQRWFSGVAWTSWSRRHEQVMPSRAQLAAVYGVDLDRPAVTAAPAAPAPAPAPRRSRLGVALRATAALVVLAVGLSLAGRAAWQMWGSNWAAARSQAALAAELDSPAMRIPVGVPLAAQASTDAAPAAPESGPAAADPGEGIGVLRIERIGLERVVVSGTDGAALRRGPGWMEDSAAPGAPGNAVISGHRTSYGAPFRRLDALEPGDRIVFSAPGQPDAVYEVRTTLVVAPGDFWVAEPTGGVRLTLTTCHPVGSDRERLVVQAELVAGAHAADALPASAWAPSAPR